MHEAEPSHPSALAICSSNSRVGQDPFGEAMNPVVIAVFCRTRCCVVLQSVGSPTDLLLSCDSISSGWRFGWLAINQHPYLFSCFLVEGSRLSSPLTGRVEILNHSKETNWSQHTTGSAQPIDEVAQYQPTNQSYQWISLLLIIHCTIHNIIRC